VREPQVDAAQVSDPVVAVTHLSRRFGSTCALDDVTFTVPRGCVFGLVGENGAGKSTLVKHLLGLWRAESGSVHVFNLDPVQDPAGVLSRIGYLSEQPDLPDWMRVEELLHYTAAFYPGWDASYAGQLLRQFGLASNARVKTLSKGQRARLGLIAAEAHRPDLLILDEPSSGLDPIVRHDILEAIVRTVSDEGRTVIFSSHLLDEVERVSDHLAMLSRGALRLCAPLDEITARHRRMVLRFDVPQLTPPDISGAIHLDGAGREWTVLCDVARTHTEAMARHLGASIVEDSPASLDEIFVGYSRQGAAMQTRVLRTVT
jgi:ABC-2 type transport system ATP-binding protein